MRDIAVAFTLGFIGASGWWFGVAVPRRKAYEDYYRNYQPGSSGSITSGDNGGV